MTFRKSSKRLVCAVYSPPNQRMDTDLRKRPLSVRFGPAMHTVRLTPSSRPTNQRGVTMLQVYALMALAMVMVGCAPTLGGSGKVKPTQETSTSTNATSMTPCRADTPALSFTLRMVDCENHWVALPKTHLERNPTAMAMCTSIRRQASPSAGADVSRLRPWSTIARCRIDSPARKAASSGSEAKALQRPCPTWWRLSPKQR